MSKYNKLNFNLEEFSPLTENEVELWSGKPKKSAFIMNNILTMAPIALLWLAFDSFFIINILKTGAGEMMYFIIPFFAFHLMPVWIWLSNILTANRKWKNTKYYVTDKRIIIQNGLIGENFQTIYYKDIKNVNMHVSIFDKILNVADIRFEIGSMNMSNGKVVMPAFFDIEDYMNVYNRLQKIVLDIQTDIEYPNALRPDNNPGYNTKYK